MFLFDDLIGISSNPQTILALYVFHHRPLISRSELRSDFLFANKIVDAVGAKVHTHRARCKVRIQHYYNILFSFQNVVLFMFRNHFKIQFHL